MMRCIVVREGMCSRLSKAVCFLCIAICFAGAKVGLAEGETAKVPESSDATVNSPTGSDFGRDLGRIKDLRSSLLKSGKAGGFVEYDKETSEIQRNWIRKEGEQRTNLGMLTLSICEPLSSGLFKDRRQYDLARERALAALEPVELPVTVELGLAEHVSTDIVSGYAPTGDDFAKRRRQDVEVRLHAWRRLLDAIDPKWDLNNPPPGPNSVAPPAPPGAPRPPGGIAPEAIADPALRAKYQAEIDRNQREIAAFTEQYRLRQWLKTFPPAVERYIVAAYSRPPFDTDELKEYLRRYRFDAETRNRILAAVETNIAAEKKETRK